MPNKCKFKIGILGLERKSNSKLYIGEKAANDNTPENVLKAIDEIDTLIPDVNGYDIYTPLEDVFADE